jgi:hypothetical protein
MEPSGTVETKLWSSSQLSREAAHGEVRLPPGLQVSEWVLKSPARRIGEEGSGMKSRRWARFPW